MASKIRVKGEPYSVSKVVAYCLIRRMLACWVVRNKEIERITPAHPLPAAAQPRKRYIPAKMPYAEVRGIRFKMPELTETLWPDTVFPDLPRA